MVRYDARSKACLHPLISQWQRQERLVKICPETSAGLPTPRSPAEIQNGEGKAVLNGSASVLNQVGQDLSAAFIEGAKNALTTAKQQHIKFALLKANSPSCSNQAIYNGHFNATLKSGAGVTAALLQQQGIQVFNEQQLELLNAALEQLEQQPIL